MSKHLKISLISVISLLVLCLSGCQGRAYSSGGEGLEIITTMFPAFDLAREICGDKAEVVLLVPPGAEAHSFEPSAQDMLRVRNCDLFIYNGGESEVWVQELLSAQDVDIPRLEMISTVPVLEEQIQEGMQHRHSHEDEPGHSHMEFDEHVWTSPVNAAIISRAIAEELCQIDPANAAYYQSRCEAYLLELDALDEGFRQAVAEGRQHSLIFADRFPARYFVEEYGLGYYAAFPGCAGDTEPSAKTVAFLIDKVEQEDIKAVFYIEFSNQKMARVIAEDTGCDTLLFHTCHNVSREELDAGVSYIGLMEQNLKNLKEALA